EQYGGVVPELASRAHQKLMIPVLREAMQRAEIQPSEISAVAAAFGPGLMGSLLVGVNFGKAFAYGLGIPFIAVNHMEAHIYSNFIDEPAPNFPLLCLTVSGGHTQLVLMSDDFNYEILGETRDDAAGEAFDKVAKMLGLGYPGGPKIDKLAKNGNSRAIDFPRSFLNEDRFAFSFSGIKTSVLYYLREHHLPQRRFQHVAGRNSLDPKDPSDGVPLKPIGDELIADICASFQSAVIDVLVSKTIDAAKYFGVEDIAIAGGVSANSALRSAITNAAAEVDCRLFIPQLHYCTDNGAMIAEVGFRKFLRGNFSLLSVSAVANADLPVSENEHSLKEFSAR
ncbi:MAG: tRNA (adenosine(37)-N6)-threonylcarbamoyltransferase complex transferase subunit TsaD, partial [Bacteroidota bacterium]|nr:tRNA (adenosine(37)-N6)-threonylcarbamoyltransferase complex transferase subunit TsaD [Bacteroidota bacterium]